MKPSTGPEGAIILDPAEAEREAEQRAYVQNVLQFPAWRLGGNLVVCVAILVHDRFTQPSFEIADYFHVIGVLLGWSLVSWGLLWGLYERLRRFDLPLAFMVGDVIAWTLAIHHTGGDQSWLFILLLVRVADQIPFSSRRALLLSHVAVVCYLGMLAYIALVEKRPLPWGAEGAKLFLVYAVSLYVVLVAQDAERLRQQAAAAMRVARRMIVEREETSRRLEDSRRQAETASEAKSLFLQNMSHELRTPLNAILGYADMLRDSAEELGHPDMLEDLARISGSGKHLLVMIQDILDLTKLESDQVVLKQERVDVATLCGEVVARARPLAEANGNGIALSVEPDAGRLIGEAERVRQVLFNLVDNACKFTRDGSVRVDARREHGHGTDWIRLRVTDTGIGMTEEQIAALFTPFTQVDAAATRRYGGTGLGLVLSQRFTLLMGGDFEVESSLGNGSCFTVRLPADTPDENVLGAA